MKLDPRIKSVSDILTPFDTERAEQFIGQKGYFGIRLVYFSDLKKYCMYGTLAHILANPVQVDPFLKMEGDDQYQFFIPESSLKPIEKKYRPYTLEEFMTIFPIGRPIEFKAKETDGVRLRLALLGYREYSEGANIYIGPYYYDLEELFEDYEWHEDATGDWVPFGVEE